VIGFRVRPATKQDSAGIRALFEQAYGAVWPEDEWAWKFLRNPDGWFGIVAESEDGRIVGNFSGWPMQWNLGGELRRVYGAGDVATSPDARGLGKKRNIYGDMATAFYDTVRSEGAPFTVGFPHPRAHEISRRLGRTRDYFPVREVRVPCASFPPPPAGIEASDYVTETFDPLWSAASRILSAAPVRDRERTNWRFHARPTRYYRMVRLVSGTEDLAWTVLSIVGEEAIVADFLGREADGRDLPALFSAAAAEAKRLGASRLRFWKSPGGPGRTVIDALGGEEHDAGFWIVGRIFDEDVARLFLDSGHFVPSLWDVV
jgi:GNAT superfamily N-acetyltransferase